LKKEEDDDEEEEEQTKCSMLHHLYTLWSVVIKQSKETKSYLQICVPLTLLI